MSWCCMSIGIYMYPYRSGGHNPLCRLWYSLASNLYKWHCAAEDTTVLELWNRCRIETIFHQADQFLWWLQTATFHWWIPSKSKCFCRPWKIGNIELGMDAGTIAILPFHVPVAFLTYILQFVLYQYISEHSIFIWVRTGKQYRIGHNQFF